MGVAKIKLWHQRKMFAQLLHWPALNVKSVTIHPRRIAETIPDVWNCKNIVRDARNTQRIVRQSKQDLLPISGQ